MTSQTNELRFCRCERSESHPWVPMLISRHMDFVNQKMLLGIDFTSAPKRNKPIVVCTALLKERVLHICKVYQFYSISDWVAFLKTEPNWIAGVDLPFSMPTKFIDSRQWPTDYSEFLQRIFEDGEPAFYQAIKAYMASQPSGQKLLQRETDRENQAISPMMLVGVPLAKMFYRGIKSLYHQTDCTLYPCLRRNHSKIALEVYPSGLIKKLINNASYKNDAKVKQTPQHKAQRETVLAYYLSSKFKVDVDFEIRIPVGIRNRAVTDPSGDSLDALTAVIQAAWACLNHSLLDTDLCFEGLIVQGPTVQR